MKQSVKGVLGQSYFSIDELCQSATAKKYGIDNNPSEDAKRNLQSLIDNVLDPARKELGSYIKINNGYRSKALNDKLRELGYNPSSTSQHCLGEAADTTAGSVDKNRQLFEIYVRQGNFDQLIWEHSSKGQWIHVSYRTGRLRGEILSWNGNKYTNIKDNWKDKLV